MTIYSYGDIKKYNLSPERKLLFVIFRIDPPYDEYPEEEPELKKALEDAIDKISMLPPKRKMGLEEMCRRIERLKRLKEIIRLRFGLGLTHKEIGEYFGGLSRETIRAKEAKALRMLRHPTRNADLKHFLSVK